MTPRFTIIFCAMLLIVPLGCREDRYFGPYELDLPTEIQARATARTFELPLDDRDREELENLERCREEEPEREIPCICDYPVLTVSEQQVRIDYRLTHDSGDVAKVMVWIGRRVGDSEPDPEYFEDLPDVEVLAEHNHQLNAGQVLDDVFLENETHAVDLSLASLLHPACEQEITDLPVPLTIFYGMAFQSDDQASVSANFTIRIVEND